MRAISPSQILMATVLFFLGQTIALHMFLPANQTILPFFSQHKVIIFALLWCSFVSLIFYSSTRPLPILLLDYSCHKPESERRCSLEVCEYFGLKSSRYSAESEAFMRAIYRKSGLGDETYAPPYIFNARDYDARFLHAITEAEEGMLGAAESVLCKTGVDPSRVTVLIVACSMFSPAPSLSAMIVNHLKLSPSVKSFNLSGMGCSAGTMSMDLASRILRKEVGYALIVVTESTGLNWYFGENYHMLVTNCIFRCGSSAALLTSDPASRNVAKMELVRTLRTHHGADDAAYNAALQMDDKDGNVGVALTKDLVRVAGTGLKNHITKLAPSVLPVSEMLRYAYKVGRSFLSGDKKAMHVPDFRTAFEHMCIHAGGKAVIDAVGRLMKFEEEVVEPARMCLHRFGNTSSSLVLYELAYFEAKGRIKRGDRVWMLAFGTGFKVCSVVWRALRDSWMDPDNPWKDCVHRYPVKLIITSAQKQQQQQQQQQLQQP